MFAIKKKSGAWRGVVDFRELNHASENDSHPIPRIEDILVDQGNRSLFSVLDLKDAFHQVPMLEESRPYSCMSSPKGTHQWRVMAQGLKNGPSTFQRVVEYVLRDVNDVANAYFDDIIVGTPARPGEDIFEKHEQDLRRVLAALEKEQLVADGKKCKLFVREVEFCGHVLSGGIRKPAPGKLAAVQLWGPPPTVTALRSFLGVINYYSSYVPRFAELAGPIMEKLKVGKTLGKAGSKAPIDWSEEDKQVFEELKRTLLETIPLQTVQPDRPFVLFCDASDKAIGASLEQLPENDKGEDSLLDRVRKGERCTRPVAFLSRKLVGAQARTWSVREKKRTLLCVHL